MSAKVSLHALILTKDAYAYTSAELLQSICIVDSDNNLRPDSPAPQPYAQT